MVCKRIGLIVGAVSLLAGEANAEAEKYEQGTWVVVISAAEITNGDERHVAAPGTVATVQQNDGNRLLIHGERNGWIGVRHVVQADGAAFQRLTDMIAHAPNEANLYLGRGVVGRVLGNFDEALADIDASLAIDPDRSYAHTAKAVTLMWKGQYDQANAAFDEAIRLAPTSRWAYHSRGEARSYQRQHKLAIEDFTAALKIDPSSARILVDRGLSWCDQNEFDKALNDFSAAIRIDSENALAYSLRGAVLAETSQFDAAVKDFSEAIRITPNHGEAYFCRAQALSAQSKQKAAAADYSEAIRLMPKNPRPYFFRGQIRTKQHEHDLAIADYTKAIKLEPSFVHSYHGRAHAWFMKGDRLRAINDCNLAIGWNSEDAFAYRFRGECCIHTLEFDDAIEDFEASLELDPEMSESVFGRCVALLLKRDKSAQKGFRKFVETSGWSDDHAGYAAVYAYFAARINGDDEGARAVLNESIEKLDESWPLPAVRYLSGGITENALLEAADNQEKKTTARCCAGMEAMLNLRHEKATNDFIWVRDHGDRNRYEYVLAVTNLERLRRRRSETAR